jgi:hypothetical protein
MVMPVTMNTFVDAIRSFESIGDRVPVETGAPAEGFLAGHAVAQSAAQDANINEVLQLIRATSGLSPDAADIAGRCFGDMAASGKPITGREIAAVLTSLVHGAEMDAGFDPQKTLEEFADYLTRTPLHAMRDEEFPPDLAQVTQQDAEAFVERNTAIAPASPSTPHQRPTPELDGAIDDMHALLGTRNFETSPNFSDGIPKFTREVKTFCGRSYETLERYWRNKAEENGIFSGICTLLANIFKVTPERPTEYEDRCLLLESMRNLERNWDEIEAAFNSDVNAGSQKLGSLTRLVIHAQDNGGAVGSLTAMRLGLETFKVQYSAAKANGELSEFFFQALDGACFPSRLRHLQEYAEGKMSAAEASTETQDPAVWWARGDNITQACSMSLEGVFELDETMNWAEVRAHLLADPTLKDVPFAKLDAIGNAVEGEYLILDENTVDEVRGYLENILCYEFR